MSAPPVGPRCLHIYPDGTQCSLPAVIHEEVPGLAERHAYPPHTRRRPTMSSDTLRRAAAAMRESTTGARFILAVADLLDRAADEPWCCDECKYAPENDNWVLSALTAARAYLGEDA